MKNIIKLFFTLLLLNSCGFTPIYQENSKLSSIEVIYPEYSVTSSIFANYIQSLLDPYGNSNKNYELNFSIEKLQTPIAIEQDRTVTRYKMTATVNYVLKEKTGEVVSKGYIKREGGYDRVASDYATYVSEEDTLKRVLRQLAEDLKLKLISDVG